MDKGWYNNSSSYNKGTLLAQTLRLDGNANMYPVLEFKRKVIKFDSLVKNIITYFQKLQSCFFRHFEKIHFEDLHCRILETTYRVLELHAMRVIYILEPCI